VTTDTQDGRTTPRSRLLAQQIAHPVRRFIASALASIAAAAPAAEGEG